MAWRFRCEHCGKRLQVDQDPGTNVRCPHCQNAVVVPADAQLHQDDQQGAADQDGLDEQESTGDAIVAFMATYLPSWGTSVVLHLALGLIIMAVAQQMQVEKEPPAPETVTIERAKEMVFTEDSAERSRSAYKEQTRDSSSWAYKKSDNPLPDLTDNKLKQVELIGVAGGGSRFGGMSGFGAGRGGGSGGGGFFGVGAKQARDIIYVVDRSGSMTDSFMYVKYELIRSISKLKPNQRFHVIFYSSGPGVEMPTRQLTLATEVNKQKAYDFINGMTPEGQTDPSDALEKAFRQKPQLIHLLTDGEFDPEILNLVNRLNKDKLVTVNTITFLYTMGENLCMQIAEKNSGVYKHVDSDWIRSVNQGH